LRASPAGRGRLPASTPVLFVIDGDPRVAHALRDDLPRRFGREFRIVCESAADAGLAVLRPRACELRSWKRPFPVVRPEAAR